MNFLNLDLIQCKDIITDTFDMMKTKCMLKTQRCTDRTTLASFSGSPPIVHVSRMVHCMLVWRSSSAHSPIIGLEYESGYAGLYSQSHDPEEEPFYVFANLARVL